MEKAEFNKTVIRGRVRTKGKKNVQSRIDRSCKGSIVENQSLHSIPSSPKCCLSHPLSSSLFLLTSFPSLFNNNSLILPLVQNPLFLIKWKVENLWPFSQFIGTKDDTKRRVALPSTKPLRRETVWLGTIAQAVPRPLSSVYYEYTKAMIVGLSSALFPQVHNCPTEFIFYNIPSFVTFVRVNAFVFLFSIKMYYKWKLFVHLL